MNRKIIGGLISLIGLAVLLTILWSLVSGARAAALAQSGDQEPARERQDEPLAPDISFIDSPTAQCIRAEQHTDACYIQWNYLAVTATSPHNILTMTVTIDGRLRAHYSGFFQSSMFVPQGMQDPGFKVACGVPGAGGNPQLGKIYSYVIQARETGGLQATNYGAVTCPADVVPVREADLLGPLQGYVGDPYEFTAAFTPVTATLPITSVWQISDQPTLTVTHGLSDTQTFQWGSPGPKNLTIDASNAGGSASATHSIDIRLYTIFLPLSLRDH